MLTGEFLINIHAVIDVPLCGISTFLDRVIVRHQDDLSIRIIALVMISIASLSLSLALAPVGG